MIDSLCEIFGRAQITPDDRDGLMTQILDCYTTNGQPSLPLIIGSLCREFSDDYLGKGMSLATAGAVLTQIVKRHKQWCSDKMAVAMTTLCCHLGGMAMSPGCIDWLVATILTAHAVCSPTQLGALIHGLSLNLFGGTKSGPITPLDAAATVNNLHAVLSQLLGSYRTSSQLQMGMMVYCVYFALRRTKITSTHRQAMLACIEKSGREQEITKALKLTENGQDVLDFLNSGT